MRASTLFLSAALPIALAGCYESHLGGGTSVDGGAGCGAHVCTSGQRCCELCHGATLCLPAGEMCPVPDCPPEGCTSNADCASGTYCAFPMGTCGAPGFCDARPTDCTTVFAPVCGCGGTTYSNACLASYAGVSVASDGPCGTPCGRGRPTCGPAEYCDLGPACGADDGVLGCRPRPRDCPPGGPPVCGCDGTSYPSACAAAMAGVTTTTPDRCGGPDPSAVCLGICDLLVSCGAPMECYAACTTNLADCSADELGRVAACTATADCMRAAGCLADIPCAR